MNKRSPAGNTGKRRKETIAVLARLRAGDRPACEEWVESHYQKIYCYHLRLTHHPQMAEDLTQDTFRSAWKALNSFEGNSSFHTWLHRIAYNSFVSWSRKKNSRQCPQADLICHERTVRYQQGQNPRIRLMKAERAEQLERMLWKLVEASRQVLVLHYLQGLSYREMAIVMDEPAGTIKWRTSKALNELRECLKEETANENA